MLTRFPRLRRCRDLRGGSFALEVDGPVPVTARLDDLLQKLEGPVYEAGELRH